MRYIALNLEQNRSKFLLINKLNILKGYSLLFYISVQSTQKVNFRYKFNSQRIWIKIICLVSNQRE